MLFPERRGGGVQAQLASALRWPDDDPIHVCSHHVARPIVARAGHRVVEAGQLVSRPRPQRTDIGMTLFLPGQVQLAFQAFLAKPQLRQPIVEQRQVRHVNVHGQRRHQIADLLDFAGDPVGVGGAVIPPRRLLDEQLDGLVKRLLVGQDDLLELAQHPGFQRLGAKGRWRRADGLAM
ncbi:MAG: hypothetical protein HUU26_00580 [Gemmatimonadaceae bacterium]|nr:hypothetical protein [Phycisphaerae bacterium]NUQ10810.1 hypothetical protein [Gemmatimonadaceae bacterium]